MKEIISAQYVQDGGAANSTVEVTFDDGSQSCVPADGTTWINHQLSDWVAGGGTIAAAPPVSAK